jgi:TRAP-type transport system periplasmic protein
MKMKRFFCSFSVVVFIFFLAANASAKVVIKLSNAGPNNPDNRTVKAVEIFKAMVEKGTGGEVEVQAFHASALGNERESLEGIKMGTIQMGTLSSGPVAGFFSPVMVMGIPYLFSSAPAAWNAYEGDFGRAFAEAFLKQTGVRILGMTENGYRHFTNNSREIKEPKDMKGLKIRTMENPVHMEMVKSLGGAPTPIAFGELYTALQQKVVDGMECPIVLIHDMKFYEVQKYMSLDGHLYDPLIIFINEEFYQKKLTPEQQKAVADAAKVLAASHNGFSQQANIEGLQKLKEKGMIVYQPTKEDMAQYRELTQPAALAYLKGQVGQEWVDKALAAAKKGEQAVGDKADQIIKDHIKLANDKYAELVKK